MDTIDDIKAMAEKLGISTDLNVQFPSLGDPLIVKTPITVKLGKPRFHHFMKARMTLCVLPNGDDPDTVLVGLSQTSKEDTFCRRIGRLISEGRARSARYCEWSRIARLDDVREAITVERRIERGEIPGTPGKNLRRLCDYWSGLGVMRRHYGE